MSQSILDNRPALAKEVNDVAEVAGYLWQKGWAERNGGNITVNITDQVDDAIRAMPAIAEPVAIGLTLPTSIAKVQTAACATLHAGQWTTVL